MLKSMMLSDMEKKESSILSEVDDKPSYPYGLRINLNADVIKKLGLSEMPEVGSKVNLVAVAEVVTVNKEKEVGDVAEYSIELQIQDLDVKGESKDKKTSNMFYGEGY